MSKNLPRRNFLFVEIRLNAFDRLTEFQPFVNFYWRVRNAMLKQTVSLDWLKHDF